MGKKKKKKLKPRCEGGTNFGQFLLPHSRNSETLGVDDYASPFLFLIIIHAVRAVAVRGFFTHILQTADEK